MQILLPINYQVLPKDTQVNTTYKPQITTQTNDVLPDISKEYRFSSGDMIIMLGQVILRTKYR